MPPVVFASACMIVIDTNRQTIAAHKMTQTKPQKITLELTFDEAFNLKSHLVDSSCYWHKLWQDAMDGRRPELDAKACQSISKRAQEFYDKIEELGVIA